MTKVHFQRGLRLFDRRWYSAALWEWQQHLPAARRDPAELARTFNAMSTALLEQGEAHQAYIKAELARDAASQLACDHPQSFYAQLNGAIAALDTGDLERARALAAGALSPCVAKDIPSERRAQLMVLMAHIAIECEQYETAATWLSQAEEGPRPTNRWRILSVLALNAAICRGALGGLDAGEDAFGYALDVATPVDLANVYAERGWMRLRHGDHRGALADAREVVDCLLAAPAFMTLPDAADALMLLSALARAHQELTLSSRLYMQGFAWLATAGWRAHLRRSTRAVAVRVKTPAGQLDVPKWKHLIGITEALAAGEHRGPAGAQRFGRMVHNVVGQFGAAAQQDMLSSAAVFMRLPSAVRPAAALPAQALVRRLEHGRKNYDAQVLALLDSYDRALVEEGQPYPTVLERMTREAGTMWDPRAVHRIVLAHAS